MEGFMDPIKYIFGTVVYGLLALVTLNEVLRVYFATTDPVPSFVLLVLAAFVARLVLDLTGGRSGTYDFGHLFGLTLLMAVVTTVLTMIFSTVFAPWVVYIVSALVAHLGWDWFEEAAITHRPVHPPTTSTTTVGAH